MRTSFELKIVAKNLSDAKETAIKEIASFLEIDEKDVLNNVNVEFKVSYSEAKTLGEITEAMDELMFVVTVFGSVKQSIAKPIF